MGQVLVHMIVVNLIIKKVLSKSVLEKDIICKKVILQVQEVMIILSLAVKVELLYLVSRIKELFKLHLVQGLMILSEMMLEIDHIALKLERLKDLSLILLIHQAQDITILQVVRIGNSPLPNSFVQIRTNHNNLVLVSMRFL